MTSLHEASVKLSAEYERLRAEIRELGIQRARIWKIVPRLEKLHTALPWENTPPVDGAAAEPYEQHPVAGEPVGP